MVLKKKTEVVVTPPGPGDDETPRWALVMEERINQNIKSEIAKVRTELKHEIKQAIHELAVKNNLKE